MTLAAFLAAIALVQGPPETPATSPVGASGAGVPQASVATTVVPEDPPPPAAPVIDYTARFDLGSYEAALGGIAAAYPDLLRVKSLGKSREGKDIWLAVVADVTSGEPGRLPGVLVATSLAPVAGGSPRGPEAAVFALAELLRSARSDSAVRERLKRTAVYFLPVLDPDGAFPAVGAATVQPERPPDPRRARLDRDFPARWSPFSRDAASEGGPPAAPVGPYPLSEPESRLLARFLVERTNLSAVVVLSEPADSASDAPSHPGSLEAFCLDVLDATLVRPAPWTGAPRSGAVGQAPEGFHAVAALVRGLAEDLPRLECAASKVERLRPDLWIVDLSVANEGRMASAGRSERAPVQASGPDTGASSVRLRTTGGRVVGCAVRRPGAENFESLRPAKSVWMLGDLGGKETLAVRLVVQADEGAAVEAVFEGPRGGRARAEVSLR